MKHAIELVALYTFAVFAALPLLAVHVWDAGRRWWIDMKDIHQEIQRMTK